MSLAALLSVSLFWSAPEPMLGPRPWLLPAWQAQQQQLLYVSEDWQGDALYLRGPDDTAPARPLWREPQIVIDEVRWLGPQQALVRAHFPAKAPALWALDWAETAAGASPKVAALSPSDWAEGQRRGAQIIDGRAEQVLFSLDRRAPHQPDLYRWQPTGGPARVAEVNPGGVLSWRVDGAGTPRLRQSYRIGPEQPVYRWEWRQEAYGAWTPLAQWQLDQPAWRPLRFATDDALWVAAETSQRDTHALHRISLLAGALSAPEVASRGADLTNVWWSSQQRQPALVEWSSLLPHQRALLPQWQQWQQQLRALDPGAHWLFRQMDEASAQGLVTRLDGQRPQSWWRFQPDAQPQAVELGSEWPQPRAAVAPLRVLRWNSPQPDGSELALSAYYQGPETQNPETGAPAPLLVLVHGGPWARDPYQYDPLSARLAQLGIGVLKVNFRGSTGLGREFLLASRGEWGKGMQRDLLEGITQVVVRGWADPQRVCIGGMSYGGYAALQAVLTQPEHFRCALAHAAVTDLDQHIRWLEQGGQQLGAAEWRSLVGDPQQDEAALKEASPISRAAQLKRPVMLSHGAKDGVVAPIHSLQFLAQAPAEQLYWRSIDGGHALERASQRQQLWAEWIRFLQAQLLAPSPTS